MKVTLPTRLALATAGAGLALAGVVLLLRAAWGGLALALDPLWASAILGGLLALCGVLLLVAARRSGPKPPPRSPLAALAAAFLEGLRAGRATGSHGR